MENYKVNRKAYALTGAAVGAIAPIVATRYMMMPKSDNIAQEIAIWTISTIASIIPSAIGAVAGLGAGIEIGVARESSRREKLEKKVSN
ncbi:MAG: hypothetical protein AABW51_03045 [Nanoarchaeota archaeon]